MAKANQYSEIGKKAREILHSNYFFDKKLEISTKPKKGLEVEFNAVTKGDDTNYHVELEAKKNDLKVEVKINQKSKVHLKLEHENLYPGLKLISSGTYNEPESLKLESKWKSKKLCLAATLSSLKSPKLDASWASRLGDLAFGAEAAYDIKSKDVKKYNLGAEISKSDTHFAVILADKRDTLKAYLTSKLQKGAFLALEAIYSFPKKETSWTVGASYKLDSDAKLKLRINDKGKIGTTFSQDLGKAELSVSVETDSKDLKATPRIGFSIEVDV